MRKQEGKADDGMAEAEDTSLGGVGSSINGAEESCKI